MVAPPVKDPHTESRPEDPAGRLVVGQRVSVRYRLPEGAGAGATDVVGRLVGLDETALVVEGRRGAVTVRRGEVIAAKQVPPAPARRGPAHVRVSADDLEVLAAQAWPAVHRERLGSWLLRSSSGFTGRACSVLAVGDPGLPLDEAIDAAERWYAERGEPAIFQVHGPPGFEVEDIPVAAVLLRRGYAVGGGRADWERVLVMTAATAGVPDATATGVEVEDDDRMSPEWLSAYTQGRPPVPGATEHVLTGAPGLHFLTARDNATGRVVGVARVSTHPLWAGIFGVWVAPTHRRRGVARALTSAVAAIAREGRMGSIYLQVSDGNTAAIRLYEDLGFAVHHEYTYLTRPAA